MIINKGQTRLENVSQKENKKNKRTILWRRYIPYLLFYIDLGFFSMRTSIAYRKQDSLEYEYVSLSVKVFNKSFEISLYTTDKRIIYRG